MRKFGYLIVFTLVAGLLFTTAHMISAQQQRRQGAGRQFGRRQFDPAEMLERQLERIMEQMNLPAEEAAVIEPMIEKILRTRMDQGTESNKLLEELQSAMDADAKDSAQIKEKLEAFKKKQAEHRKKSEELEKGLLELLSVEQEAQLTILRVVNSDGGGGFMRFGGFGNFRRRGGAPGGGPPGGPPGR